MFDSRSFAKFLCIFFLAALLCPMQTLADTPELKKEAIENMFEVNLGIKKGEKVLVFTDDYKSEITEDAKLVAKIGESFGEIIFSKYTITRQHGMEPPKSLWEKAFG